jgi:hypothetical protein
MIFRKIFWIIAIVAVIAIGMSACGTFGAPREMDEETLALKETFDSASWDVKVMNNTPTFRDFTSVRGNELVAFQNSSVIQNMEFFRWYALSAPEMPGTFYYYTKLRGGFSSIRHDLYKSTTIDAETFASRNAFFNATWQAIAMSSQPSTIGLEKLDQFSMEATFLGRFLPSQERYDKWYSITAREMPGIIYYYFERMPNRFGVTIGETTTVYRGRQ